MRFIHLRTLCLAAVLVLAATGCSTRGQLTAKAIGCNAGDVDLKRSAASRRGVTTDWCARCKGETYHCLGNADRDKVVCRPAREEDGCG